MTRRRGIAAASVLAALIASGCSGGGDQGENTAETDSAAQAESASITEPVVVTYDGGVAVLDGKTLEVKADVPMEGFLRVNPAGDASHVLVTTSDGFQALNASTGQLTDVLFPAVEAGHVVVHGENTVLFADGTGEVTIFDPHDLESGDMPETEMFSTPAAHHGVAVVLEDGTRLRSEGDDEGRTGAVAMDPSGAEIASSAECPGLHGEGVAGDGVAIFGCENGALMYKAGAFNKVAGPGEYGRLGTVKGHPESPVALADFKVDPDAELERPNQFALVDTAADQLRVVPLPAGVSYSWRSLERGPHAEALILGTDGKLHVIDPATAEIIRSVDVVAPWTEPQEWQQPRPAVFTRGHDVYVTEPASNEIHIVEVETGEVTRTAQLPNTPNEVSGPMGHEH
ncbi:zinc metallochaperone AztD [soil metagenome]